MEKKEFFRFKRVRQNSKLFLAMTSLTQEEFLKLLPSFRDAWSHYKIQHQNAGRPNQFYCIEDMLVFILYYLKCYPLQEILAYSFGMSQGDANYWIHLLSSVLHSALDRRGNLPQRRAEDLKELLDRELESRRAELKEAEAGENGPAEEPPEEPELELGIDGTERQILRPSDQDVQREFYSGKAHAHTVKNIIVGDLDNRLAYALTETVPGKKSDIKATQEAAYQFPEGTNGFVDKGFQGYRPEGATMYQPKKKPRNGHLTDKEAEVNSILSRCRIVIEHIIDGIKRLRIVKDIFRNTKDKFDDLVMDLACGLHNFREQCRAPSRSAVGET
jgi:DDE superfamily endonuclease